MTKLLHETKLETAFHKLFSEHLGASNNLFSFELSLQFVKRGLVVC